MADSDESDIEDLQDVVDIQEIMANQTRERRRIHNSLSSGLAWVHEILAGHADRCHSNFRMKRLCFRSLCERLENYGLERSMHITVKEMVAVFLYTIALALPTRQVAEWFQRSNGMINVIFHKCNPVQYNCYLTLFGNVTTIEK